MRLYLFLTRAKSPQPPADREEAGEKDEDEVRLDPRKSLDNIHHRSLLMKRNMEQTSFAVLFL